MKARHVILPLIIGFVVSLANSWIISNLWDALDWGEAIAGWLARLGLPTLARWFEPFWTCIPTFAIAAIMGVVVTRLFADRRISAVLFYAIGFVGTLLLEVPL